jgi:oligopeptide transport system permease protein
VAAIVLEIVIGILAGIIAAVFRYSFLDVLVTLSTTLAIGVPTLVIGLALQNVFAINLGWLPLQGQSQGVGRSIILPALTLAAVETALVSRLMRGTMSEVMRADFIRTAYAKGLSKRVVILKHALRNSVIPVLTFLGISFGGLLGGALITETVFNWNGIGLALVGAIQSQDNPIVLGVVTYGVAVFVLVNLVVDVAYAFLDPRIRLE